MLISCPKCRSIYEIPDDLIGKTGQNFRCQTCATVWHAMRQDALDYTEDDKNEPYIEAISLKADDRRNFPASSDTLQTTLNAKSGRITRSSDEVLAREGKADYTPTFRKNNEIVLTSDHGASFTITPPPAYDDKEETKVEPTLGLTIKPEDIRIKKEDRLEYEKPFKGYRKTTFFLCVIAVLAALALARRDVVSLIPELEPYYNKIGLTGFNNPEYLTFGTVNVTETNKENTKGIMIKAEIKNDSRFATIVPNVTTAGITQTPARGWLKAGEKTYVEIFVPVAEQSPALNLILTFVKP